MRPVDYARLFVLAAIWGSSFIFMRVIVPSVGPFGTADLRVLIAGLVLVAYLRMIGFDAKWRTHWRQYAVIGIINCGIPFPLFCFAALHLPASYSAIINSLAPLFGALFSAIWLREPLTGSKLTGLALGISGVGLIAYRGGAPMGPMFLWAVLACGGATMCYGLGAVYTKKHANGLPPLGTAAWSQLTAGILLLPAFLLSPPLGPFSWTVAICVLALAIVCSAIAYGIAYKLIADVGPTRALTVTFLVPVFGLLWAKLFLGEKITAIMLPGCALVVLGTLLVGGVHRSLFKREFQPA